MTTKSAFFDSGTNGSNITTANNGGTDLFTVATGSGTFTRVFQSSGALKGALSARITCPTATDSWNMGWDSVLSGVSGTGLTLRFYITFLADTIANGASIVQIRNASSIAASWQMNTGLSTRWNGTAAITPTIYACSTNTLYRVEVNIDPGTSTSSGIIKYALYLGDDTTTPLVSTTQTGQNFLGATLTMVRFGKNGSVGSADYLIDGITVNDTSGATLLGPIVNHAPTVSVTSPVTIAAGGSASLVSTESDSDGDTITGTWAYLSGPSTPSPASASSASTTVTITTPGRYVYRRSVSDGLLTTTGDVTIRVTTTPVQIDGTTSNAGGMTAVGAATLAAALSDSSDSTYGESVASPVNAVTVHSVAPMTTPSDKSGITLVVRARRSGGTTGTSKFELLEGATVRKDFGTSTLTGSFADYTLSLDLTSANAIVDWQGLSVRQTDNAS